MEFVFISLFGYVSVFCFFLKALFVQTNYEKEQKIVPFFSDKTKDFLRDTAFLQFQRLRQFLGSEQ